ELRANLILNERRLARCVRENLTDARRRLVHDVNSLQRASPRAQIENRRQRLDDLSRTMSRHLLRRIEIQRAAIVAAQRQLETLNPQATLNRGYAIVRKYDKIVTKPSQVASRDVVQIRVRDGEFSARVE